MSVPLGIDFGTTYTLAAYFKKNSGMEFLPLSPGTGNKALLSSALAVSDEGALTVAKDGRFLEENSSKVIFSLKRLLDGEVHGTPLAPAAASFYSVAELISRIFFEVATISEEYLKQPVEGALALPGHFKGKHADILKQAAQNAGLPLFVTVQEAEAACWAYGLEEEPACKVAVYNFGGGMFEFAVLEKRNSTFKVLASSGDPNLGGEDMTLEVAKKLLEEIESVWGKNAVCDPQFKARVRHEAERAKCAVSHRGSYDLRMKWPAAQKEYVRAISRFEVSDMARRFVERSLEHCRSALESAGLGVQVIDRVILAGGVTRMPVVQEAVESFFGKKPFSRINPDEVIAAGVARYAYLQKNSRHHRQGNRRDDEHDFIRTPRKNV